MHLLLAQRGTIADEGEAIDLGQAPADICVLSAADTELAALAAAQAARPVDAPTVRLVNQMRLAHPMSVDQWVERTGRHARLIVARVLGGRSYFPYGLDALAAAAHRHGILFAALPGDARPDPELAALSTLDEGDAAALWHDLVEGGAQNASRFLARAAAILADAPRPGPPEPLPAAGVWLPGTGIATLDELAATWRSGAPVAALTFYRALVQGSQTAPVDALAAALRAEGLNPLPLFAASLKDATSQDVVRATFAAVAPAVVLNATAFAAGTPGGVSGTVLDEPGAPVLQAILSGSTRDTWAEADQGLTARDLAMNVALPEVDGRIVTRAIAFKAAARWDARTECDIVRSEPEPDRVRFVAELARRWATIPAAPAERRVAIVLANYPNRDGRIANGVGLDTPAGTLALLQAMQAEGYATGDLPADGNALVERLQAGPTNANPHNRPEVTLARADYDAAFAALPGPARDAITARWGAPDADPFFHGGAFALPLMRLGSVLIGIQPARGYNIDPKETYHAPDLVPPHGYVAFYAALRREAHALVHMGKHGNLEWLPGKALALSAACFPEAVFGPLPHIYPFIVNDPGEGAQAKRRTQAVIVDHLTPPLTRAESHGPMRDLEALVDEYYDASGGDPRRTRHLAREILDLSEASGLAEDIGLAGLAQDAALERLDAWLCELKELQIRDGLHVFGRSPEGHLRTDLLVALARPPRGERPQDASLLRALAADLRLADGTGFDPLDSTMSAPWTGPRPAALTGDAPWRTEGDTIERLEARAARLIEGEPAPAGWTATHAVLHEINTRLAPAVDACGPREIAATLAALAGRFVAPGPSGAPSRGRPDVLPTGRNFYSVDTRAVPTPAAWEIGRRSAELVLTRHLQDHGDWPTSIALSCWGTANMRTGGDDIAQAMALIGAKPVWDPASRRVTGYEITPLAVLGRPRIDVTLRISGFFRDAFPDQIALFDRAVRAIGALEEDPAENPIAPRMRAECRALVAAGTPEAEAALSAGHRIFGAKPGAYGAGLQALVDEGGWNTRDDLAEAFTVWGGYAYGARAQGTADRTALAERLGTVDAVLHNQDNREHDLLDSDDYYQFEGGLTAAVHRARGERPAVYHNDHSRPERPVVRTLEEEIARVVRGRVTNPKWIAGVMRHGYKGAFEIAATVDYMFAFAATTGAVKDHHFDAAYAAFVADEAAAAFMRANNPAAWADLNARLAEAITRGLWHPRSNAAAATLAGAG
ncbi:cobaltochelatase subunit CobN [Acuticoccus sp. I52.16.1]|uniref:cobaltochelatase subunit CobN n=1 Tax=Acuticoccus sp. I52.16.1 TaxID=2928472 RepID=UPI001FD52A31|nr:cobaltochelatase subunit CobN [Acuticoccus sp. I52.16.1]UOM33809.1 cobaltochelatase subunit CobN [Acuticoccus sp. I52.16.1]